MVNLARRVFNSVRVAGLVGLGGKPFLQSLMESFDFAAGGGVAWAGVLLGDSGDGEVTF